MGMERFPRTKQVRGSKKCFSYSNLFFKNVRAWSGVKTEAISKELFMQAGILLTQRFKELILPRVSSVIPSVGGEFYSLDYAKDMTNREALAKVSDGEKGLTPNQFAALFLSIFHYDGKQKDNEKKLLKTEEGKECINVFFVRVESELVMVWVEPNFNYDQGTECGLLAFGIDDIEDRLDGVRLFI